MQKENEKWSGPPTFRTTGPPVQVVSGNSSAAQVLVIYSLMIIIMPLVAYFGSKTILFEGYFGMDSSSSYFYSAIVAIVTVHILLAAFVYKAFKEDAKYEIKRD